MPSNYLFKSYEAIHDRIRDLDLVVSDKSSEFEGQEDSLSLESPGSRAYHIVMDTHEIIRYSFPVNINRLRAYSTDELDAIFDSQIAYYDLFEEHRTRPIIVSEYSDEVRSAFSYYKNFGNEVRTKEVKLHLNNFIENIVETFSRGRPGWTINEKQRNDLAMTLQLAVYEFGANRAISMSKRICFEDEQLNCDGITFLKNLKYFRPNRTLVNKIVQHVSQKPIRILDPSSLKRDIIAYDKVCFLNQLAQESESPDRFVYFSSAMRTKFISEGFSVLFPEKVSRFEPWRTPTQIYLYLILRSIDSENKFVFTRETLESLELIKARLQDVLESKDEVGVEEEISHIETTIDGSRRELLQLFFNKSEDSQLRKMDMLYGFGRSQSDPEKATLIEANLKNYINHEYQDDLRDLFRFSLDINLSEDIRLKQLRKWLTNDLNLLSAFPGESLVNDDVISNCYETFPFLIEPKVEKWTVLLMELFSYWKDYYQNVQNGTEEEFDKYRITEIVDDVLKLKMEPLSNLDDYYTMVSLLHLVNLREEANASTLNYISDLEASGLVGENLNVQYIKASAYRRSKLFSEMDRICSRVIEDNSIDLKERIRFRHCRGLGAVARVLDKRKVDLKKGEIDDLRIERGIEDLKKSIDHLSSAIPGYIDEVKAAICADIIFLSSVVALSNLGSGSPDVTTIEALGIAERFKNQLRDLKSKEIWHFADSNERMKSYYPGYFFVEAFYEFVTLKKIKKTIGVDDDSETPEWAMVNWDVRLPHSLEDARFAREYNKRSDKIWLFDWLINQLQSLSDE